MQKYEIMAIISAEVAEKEAEKTAQSATCERVKKLGGSFSFEDFWGARGFAYQIKGQKWGYYYVAQFEVDGQKLEEFKKDLNLDKTVVRFLISKVGKNDPPPKKYTEMQTDFETIQKEKGAEKADSEPVEKAETPAEKADAKPPAPAPSPKVSKDLVDQKLDEVIENAAKDL